MAISAEPAMTVRSLVDEVLDVLHGYVRDQGPRTSLASSMSSTATELAVTEPAVLSRGLVEVDDELIYVTVVDPLSGVGTVPTWGRAQSGSEAASHATGAEVRPNPLYPRQRVAQAVYGALREMFPDIFPVGQTTVDYNPVRTNYDMPADCFHVLGCEWLPPGPTRMWAPVPRWRQNKTAPGIELELLSVLWPGESRVRVQYVRTPPTTMQGDDTLSGYGYDQNIRDLVVLGAVCRLIAYTEPSRLQVQSVESVGRSEAVPAGSASTLSRYLFQLWTKRVEDERRQLQMRYPAQIHKTR